MPFQEYDPLRVRPPYFRVPRKEVGKRSSITFFHFRDSFGHFLVTFSDASVIVFVTPFELSPFQVFLVPEP